MLRLVLTLALIAGPGPGPAFNGTTPALLLFTNIVCGEVTTLLAAAREADAVCAIVTVTPPLFPITGCTGLLLLLVTIHVVFC